MLLRVDLSEWLDRIDRPSGFLRLSAAVFPLVLLIMLPVGWIPNEEDYFQLAYRRVAPDSFSPLSATFDRSNARILYEMLAGTSIALIGYEASQVFLRLTMAAIYAMSIGFLFAAFGLSILRALAVIASFSLAREHLFGGEWFFQGVESKTFAYAAVIAAFGFALRARWIPAILLTTLATYFHFLVGGFWALALILLAALRDVEVKTLSRNFALYFLLVAPLIGVVIWDQLLDPVSQIAGMPSVEAIYAARVPHHIAPFSFDRPIWLWLGGAAKAILVLVFFVILRRRTHDKSLPNFIIFLVGYFFIVSAIAYLDRDTHIFAKFFMFRPTSFILFLSLAIALGFLPQLIGERPRKVLALCLVAVIAVNVGVKVYKKTSEAALSQKLPEERELIAEIVTNSGEEDIVLIEPVEDTNYPYVGLNRRIPRPTLVSYKFIPTNPSDIVDWYQRLQFRKTVFDEGCRDDFAYPVRLLLVFSKAALERTTSCGPIVWQGEAAILIRVER